MTSEPHKRAEIESRDRDFMAGEASKPFGWESYHWVKWATIADVLQRLGVSHGAAVLDLGCGPGWISLFLAESGLRVTAVDLVPANVELTRARAERWGLEVDARLGDMDELELGASFDLVLVYDALHHSSHQRDVVRGVAAHLRPGGWAFFGEPSWLHDLSPRARGDARRRGWRERGVRLHALKRDCRAAGLGEFRRFFQGTEPYERRGREFGWQLLRLVTANVAVAPGAQLWLAARRSES